MRLCIWRKIMEISEGVIRLGLIRSRRITTSKISVILLKILSLIHWLLNTLLFRSIQAKHVYLATSFTRFVRYCSSCSYLLAAARPHWSTLMSGRLVASVLWCICRVVVLQRGPSCHRLRTYLSSLVSTIAGSTYLIIFRKYLIVVWDFLEIFNSTYGFMMIAQVTILQ